VDLSREAVLHERGDGPAVVDVGVRQDDRVHRSRVEAQLAVALFRLFAPPLEEPAIEEDPLPVDLEKMAAAGDTAGGPVKSDFHSVFPCSPGGNVPHYR
jgi:hypothetical protein